jgi:hypothetical protein
MYCILDALESFANEVQNHQPLDPREESVDRSSRQIGRLLGRCTAAMESIVLCSTGLMRQA